MSGRSYVGSGENRYLYQGKELQNETGWYDFGARMYDPTIGRFNSVDALADHPNQIGLSPYSAMWNNPIRYDDPDGNCPICPIIEAAVDIGFTLYDAGEIAYQYATTGEVDPISVAALAADATAIVVPFATGAGLGVRATAKAASVVDNVVDTGKAVDKATDAAKASNDVDFIGFPDGTTVHKSQSKMEESLKRAGFEGENLKRADGTVKGRKYELDNVNARAMEPDGTNPRRTSFENKSSQPQPSQPGGKQVKTHETKGMTRSERKEYVRQRTHAIQNQ